MFDEKGWVKVEMEAFVYLNDSCDELARDSCKLFIYYVKLADGRICKVITNHEYQNQKIDLFGYRYDILMYNNLEFDSDMIECGRPVLNDWSKYADYYNPRPEIRILESGKIYYSRAAICHAEALPDDIIEFINNEVGFAYAV